jgi:hypothetical protein
MNAALEYAVCPVCLKPTRVTTVDLAAAGCTTATHGRCAPAKKAAGAHPFVEIVVGDERCDLTFEQEQADRTRDAWEAGRPHRDTERERTRSRMTLGERLDAAVLAVSATSSVSARPVGHEAKTTTDDRDPGPPPAPTAEIGANLTIIQFHVREIARTLDAERGLIRPGSSGLMTGDEKDKIIWEDFKGVHCEVVARDHPWLGGSGRTIMRARQREALKRKKKVNATWGTVTGDLIDGA